ncbi:Leucyl aminopeptidase yscIV, partial [Blyttiomyces sp. JEL0837]
KSQPRYGGSRSTTRGYNASVKYVVDFLHNHTDYHVWIQPVVIKDQTELSPPLFTIKPKDSSNQLHLSDYILNDPNNILQDPSTGLNILTTTSDTLLTKSLLEKTYTPVTDYAVFTGSGTASLQDSLAFHVMGCDPLLDLSYFKTHKSAIAILSTVPSPNRPLSSNCKTLCQRIVTVIQAGAKGIVVYNDPLAKGYPRPLPPTVSARCSQEEYKVMGSVPIVGMSQAAGMDLLRRVVDPNGVRIDLMTNTTYGEVVVGNVLAETKGGDDGKVLFMTAHLDSVQAGPGVNDDGSGAMATLELAHAFYRSGLDKQTVQKVRFGWWSAEETGLEGSRCYVKTLPPSELSKIKLNIDTDMIASPNYVRGVWDGYGVTDKRIDVGCRVISDVFFDWFKRKGLSWFRFPFNGRSDFVAFMDAGIPAGGVITGEDEIKTFEQAEMFGGIAGM